MAKLPVLTPKKLIDILKKIGFVLDHNTGSHGIFYHATTKRRAVVPMHTRDLPKGTLLSILKQTGITKDELTRLK